MRRNENWIHDTARIHPDTVMGKGNVIHAGVEIGGFKSDDCEIVIGDNNIIYENTRILVDRFIMGDDNTIHNHGCVLAGSVIMGDKNWVGQHSILDGTGGLTMGNQIAVGYNSYVWTHAGWKHLPEKCLLAHDAPVVIEYGVWMMGCNIVVNPGVTLTRKTVILSNSVMTEDTEEKCVYGGVPARKLDIRAWE